MCLAIQNSELRVLPRHWQQGLRGILCEEGQGCPITHTNLAPRDPPQGTAEPLRQAGGISVKICLRNTENAGSRWNITEKQLREGQGCQGHQTLSFEFLIGFAP